MKNVFLGFDSLFPGSGGIGRVARLMTRVIAEQAAKGSLAARALVFIDRVPTTDLGVPVDWARGSRARFLYGVTKAAWSSSHFVYDFVGMARAHCCLPLLRRPFLTFIHGIEVWEGTRPDRIAWARRATMLIANTAYTRDRADRLFGSFKHVPVCWLGTETDELPASRPSSQGVPRVLIVARMDQARYKGHAALIECWPKVVSKVPDAVLTIVGQGPGAAAFRHQAAMSPCASKIEFTGFVSDCELEEHWSSARVFAMPSRGEGFGLVYIEAMRHGLPVIASVHDAAPEVVLEGSTGYNIDLECPDELPDRIIHLLQNPDHARQLGEAGRQRWQEHFRYSSFRDRFSPLLNEFLRS